MKYTMPTHNTTRQAERTAHQDTSAGPNAVSMKPPAYGISFVDRGLSAPVQPMWGKPERQPEDEKPATAHQAARAGVQGVGGRLPHLDTIQASFGAYDVRHVQAYTGSRASEASRRIGAEAYTSGHKIAFMDSSPGLYVAAHEAAHVIQQQAGVHLRGGLQDASTGQNAISSAPPDYGVDFVDLGLAAVSPPGMQIQPKLTVGPPDDPYEREADRVAKQVVQRLATAGRASTQPGNFLENASSSAVRRHPGHAEEEEVRPKRLADAITPLVQRHPGPTKEEKVRTKIAPFMPQVQRHPEHAEEEEVRRKRLDGAATSLRRNSTDGVKEDGKIDMRGGGYIPGGNLEQRLHKLRGSGRPIPDAARGDMESGFGADFSGVRVHTGAESVQMNRELNAQAFTYGRDIHFGEGRYRPGTSAGRYLLAHELTHVVQQNPAAVQAKQQDILTSSISRVSTLRIQRVPRWVKAMVGGAVAGGAIGAGAGAGAGALAGGVGAAPGAVAGAVVGAVVGGLVGVIKSVCDAKKAKKKQQELMGKYGVEVGGEGEPFSKTILEELDKALTELPEGHLAGTYLKEGEGIVPATGTGDLASAYGYEVYGDREEDKEKEEATAEERLEREKKTASIMVGSPWWLPSGWHTDMEIGKKVLGLLDPDEAAILGDALGVSARYPDQGDKSIFRGIGDVHAGRKLFPYTIRHEMGHAIDHKIKFTQTRGRLKAFGGWISHGKNEWGRDPESIHDDPKAEEANEFFMAMVGLDNQNFHDTQTRDNISTKIVIARLRGGESLDAIVNFENLVIAGSPIPQRGTRPLDAGTPGRFRQAEARIQKARKSPWLLADGGGADLMYDGRRMHLDHYGRWVSYDVAAREQHGVSNYQFSSPGEWFAEAYAVYYETDPDIGPKGRARLDTPVKEWFKKNLGPAPDEEGERGALIEETEDGYNLKGLPDISKELMAFLNGVSDDVGEVLPSDLVDVL